MEYTVFRRGWAVGKLSVEDSGLYRVLRSRIAPSEDVLRLYLDGRAFGVYVPEDGALGLCRRVSRTQLPELPGRAVAWCEADGRWMPSEGGMCRHTPRGRELAVPWRTDAPMTLPAAPEKLRPLRLEGAYYLVRE